MHPFFQLPVCIERNGPFFQQPVFMYITRVRVHYTPPDVRSVAPNPLGIYVAGSMFSFY